LKKTKQEKYISFVARDYQNPSLEILGS